MNRYVAQPDENNRYAAAKAAKQPRREVKASRRTVTTDVGTFTRTTRRAYTHVVVVKGVRAEWLEDRRQREIAHLKQLAANYRRQVEAGNRDAVRYAEGYEADASKLEALGPIANDKAYWTLTPENLASEPEWTVLGWCGRFELARRLATSTSVDPYREVRIYTADGELVYDVVREVR